MQSPVRPHAASSTEGAAQPGDEDESARGAVHKEEEVDLRQVQHKDVIEGVEQRAGPIALPLPTPPSMTPAEREHHNLTHQPPHRGCPICAANRTPNIKHGPSHEHERLIPLLVGDYCFLRSIQDRPLVPCLVMRLYPYKIFFATAVPRKGAEPLLVARVARFIREMGLVHFAYRCDREHSLNALVEQACAKAGRAGFAVTSDLPGKQRMCLPCCRCRG